MAVITSLPLETLRHLASFLALRDLGNFAQSHPFLIRRLFGSEPYCRELVSIHVPESKEASLAARGTISYRKALLSVFQKRDSFARGRPFQVTSIDPGDGFFYRDGTICILKDNTITFFDARAKTTQRLDLSAIVSVETSSVLLDSTLLHYDSGVVSVRLNSDKASAVLSLTVADDGIISQARSKVTPIGHYDKDIVVRNTAKHLVVAFYRYVNQAYAWQFHAWSLDPSSPSTYDRRLEVGQFTSSDVGVDLVFEIIDDHLWIASSQITVEPESANPIAFYGGCRVNLEEPGQQPQFWKTWRRNHVEGPLDENWATLSLFKNDKGSLVITETRSEWLSPDQKVRSFYTSMFHPGEYIPAEVDDGHATAIQGLARAAWTDEWDAIEEIIAVLEDESLTVYADHRLRQPEFGFDRTGRFTADRDSTYLSTRTVASFYNQQADAFVDIVIHPHPSKPSHNIKLRFGSRRDAPAANNGASQAEWLLTTSQRDLTKSLPFPFEDTATACYIHEPITMLPAQLDHTFSRYETVGPHSTKCFADEKTVIFGPDFQKDPSARQRSNNRIIIISFDPLAYWPATGSRPQATLLKLPAYPQHASAEQMGLMSYFSRADDSLSRRQESSDGWPDSSGNDDSLVLDPIDQEMRDAAAEAAQERYNRNLLHSGGAEEPGDFHLATNENLDDAQPATEDSGASAEASSSNARSYGDMLFTSSSAHGKSSPTDQAEADDGTSKEEDDAMLDEFMAKALGLYPESEGSRHNFR